MNQGSLAEAGRVWLVGCGNMGGALLGRWVGAGLTEIDVIDPGAAGPLPGGLAARSEPPAGAPDVLVLAVKPQLWRAAVAPFADRIGPETAIISVMAGVAVAALHDRFGTANIVRAMPNTPARLGRGITALWTAGDHPGRAVAERLFAAAGQVAWLDREGDFDAVTGVSGSGPAYVFAMIEALAAAGVTAGLAGELAAQLALATVFGAAALASEGGASAAALREAVTSPNGTTAAGLSVLTPALDRLLAETVAAAAERSRQLGRTAF